MLSEHNASMISPLLQAPKKKTRQVFVAYSYKLYPKEDYRNVFDLLEAKCKVKFVFADEKITTLHILQKISNYIRESQFSIFDISGWNPNVTLELGLAFGYGETAYIAVDPSKTVMEDVPADLRGIDRIQYSSYQELRAKVTQVLAQEMPIPRMEDVVFDYIIDHEGVISLGKATKDLDISADEFRKVISNLKREKKIESLPT